MEFLEGGDLLEKVMIIEKFSEDHAVMVTHQIMLAVNYMHK